MKVYYINILCFAFPLNILVNSPQNPCITLHTPKIKPTNMQRSLCECNLYMPNYDNDPEMKQVMENFNRQTEQRFHEYDERMIKNRQKYNEQCDKDIQKIILKDRIEKQMEEQFSALETSIDTNNIPTCVCEKSLADKVEKTCLKCTQNFGGVVAPSSGVLGGIAELGLNAWKTAEFTAATKAAIAKGLAAGIKAGQAEGMAKVIAGLKALDIDKLCPGLLESFFSTSDYTNVSYLPNVIYKQYKMTCEMFSSGSEPICNIAYKLNLIAPPGGTYIGPEAAIAEKLNGIVTKAKIAAEATKDKVTLSKTVEFEAAKRGIIDATCSSYHTAIISSILAILIIVLIMVIIYLILRYRRKKKMNKKFQYIKLLKE
ncbi:PIR protein, putative [Plasmodium sp.]|nr:PIR protein, putative [Plasmodium sp.]